MKTLLDYCSQKDLTGNEIKEAISLISTSNINEKDDDGCTALIHAAYWNRKEITLALINAGAEIDQSDEHVAKMYKQYIRECVL